MVLTDYHLMELLARDTVAYFQALKGATAKKEARLERVVGQMVEKVNFDE